MVIEQIPVSIEGVVADFLEAGVVEVVALVDADGLLASVDE